MYKKELFFSKKRASTLALQKRMMCYNSHGEDDGYLSSFDVSFFVHERMIIMTALAMAVERVISSPPRKYTKQEAQEMLRRYGVLDANNSVTEEYQHIFVKKADEDNATE